MTNKSTRKLFIFLFLLTLTTGSCNVHLFHKNPEKALFGKTVGHKKEARIKEPRSALRAKKKQERNDRKLQKDYEKTVKQSQKRTIDIQTLEVQSRMKQNKKDYKSRDKEKRKKVKSSTRRAGRKYN